MGQTGKKNIQGTTRASKWQVQRQEETLKSCLGHLILRKIYSSPPRFLPEMALTFSSSLLFSLSPLMLPNSSPSHSPSLPPTLLEVQYSQEEMEETGYIPSIVGDKSATSFLASAAKYIKRDGDEDSPSILRKKQKQFELTLNCPTIRVISWTIKWQILSIYQTKALKHLNTKTSIPLPVWTILLLMNQTKRKRGDLPLSFNVYLQFGFLQLFVYSTLICCLQTNCYIFELLSDQKKFPLCFAICPR